VEVSLTQVFTRPVQGRHFFEAVGRENLDLGRPDRVGLLFPPPHHATVSAPGWDCRTRVTNGCICWSCWRARVSVVAIADDSTGRRHQSGDNCRPGRPAPPATAPDGQ
jgi:hypothetical protein